MNSSKELLKAIVGKDGLETLEKAIFKKRTNAVIDPLEYYLPLLVVPRAILSWLIQNIKPMKIDELKTLEFPNNPDIKIEIQKQDVDQYRAEFVEKGRVIHSFEKQSLPAVSGHLMTVGELYDSFSSEKDKADSGSKEEPKTDEVPSLDVARSIMAIGRIKIPNEDPEQVKWVTSQSNVKELSAVIGKLVDALVAKSSKKEETLDKAAIKEQEDQNIEETKLPETKKPAPKEQYDEVKVAIPKVTDYIKDITPEPKEAPESKAASNATITVSQYLRRRSKGMTKSEILAKPYQSEAQRRWAHTEAGTKALGGKEKVKHWDKESKGKDLPEKVNKAEEINWENKIKGKSGFNTEVVGEDDDYIEIEATHPETGARVGYATVDKQHPEDFNFARVGDIKVNSKWQNNGIGTDIYTHASNYLKKPLKMSRDIQPAARKLHEKYSSFIQKAEMPGGAAQPKKPAMPQPPKPPVPPSKNPAGAAAKQAQQSAKGKMATPKPPKPAAGSLGPKPPKVGAMTKNEYFKKKLSKSEVTESELYSHCEICGTSQFKKTEKGPEFSPCACFSVVKKDEEGNSKKFVNVLRKSDGKFDLEFSPESDPETVKLFLLSMKARLLIKKNHGL
jgi:hypothetical protein